MKPTENTINSETTERTDDDLQAGIEALGADTEGSVLIWRFQDGGFAMLERVASRDFDPWTIGTRYGAGRYRFDFMNGRNRYVKKGIERTIARPPAEPAPAAAPVPGFPGLDPLQMLLEANRRSESFQSALMLALVQNMGKGSGGGLALSDLVAVMREARESAVVPAPPHEAMLSLLREGMTLGREIEGGDLEASSSGGFAGALPQLLAIVEKVIPKAGAPAAPAALPPAARPEADPLASLLAMFSPQMIQAASSGQDPTAFARLVVSVTPPGPMAKSLRMFVFATAAQRQALYAAGAPALAPHAEWIERVCDAARNALSSGARSVDFPRAAAAPADASVEPADSEGCDDEECSDPDCTNPDHFAGCDNQECNRYECNDPEHFDDEESKRAAIARAIRRAG